MCGILGISSDQKIDDEDFKKSLSSIRHRGPDGQGILFNEMKNIAIGHRRLAIIDLSEKGNQPMVSNDDRYRITYNGEIYNFKEIRDTLIKEGYRFNSNTDTEIVMNSFIAWGPECLNLFNGMFSFCIWDTKTDEYFIARDRIGIKPLFFYHDDKTFIFSSEIKAILEFNFIDKTVDQTAIYDFFTYLYIPSPKTIYKKIKKLEHGHYLLYSSKSKKLKKYKYWELNPYNNIDIGETEAIENIKHLVNKSVKMRLVSDVPVGVLLSGGLDSSVITGIASKHYNSTLQSFTIGFNEKTNDESQFAKIVANKFSTHHTNELLNYNNFLNLFFELHDKFDEPFADSSLTPTFMVSLIASKKMKVVLSGDGGDELFYGYNWYNTYSNGEYFNGLRKVIPELINDKLLNINSISRYKKIKYCLLKNPIARLVYIRGGMIYEEKKQLLNPEFLQEIGSYDDYWHYRKFWKKDLDFKTQLQFLDLNTFLPDDILRKVDMMSMQNSLEARVPLLDHNLVEYVFSLPSKLRNKTGQKYLFKKAFNPMLPKLILNKKKKGFSVPLKLWFGSQETDTVKKKKLDQYFISSSDLINPVRKYQAKVLEHWV